METLDPSPAALAGDLVWAPLGSRKWWPARVVPDPSGARVTVSYFARAEGGGSGVCDAAALRPFAAEGEFKKMVGGGGGPHRRSDAPGFAVAVEAALVELGRRLEAGAGVGAEVSWMPAEFLRRLRGLACGASRSSALDAALVRGWASAFHRRGSQVYSKEDIGEEVEVPAGVSLPSRGPGDSDDDDRENKSERGITEILASLDEVAEGKDSGSITPVPSKPKRALQELVSPVLDEKRSEGREGEETGVGRRERRKSKYLSPPYTMVGSTSFSKAAKFLRSIEDTSQVSKHTGVENRETSVGEILVEFRAMASDPLHCLGVQGLDGSGGAVRDLFGKFRSSVYMGENKRKDDAQQGRGDGTQDRKNEKSAMTSGTSVMTPEVVNLRGHLRKNPDGGESGNVEGAKPSGSGRTSLVGRETEAIGSDKGREGDGRTPKSRKTKPLDVEVGKPSGSGRTSVVGKEAEANGSDKGEEGCSGSPMGRKRKPLDVEEGKLSSSGGKSLVGKEAEAGSSDKGEEGRGRTPKSRKRKPLDVEGGKPSSSRRRSLVGKEAEASGSDKDKEGHGRTPKSRKRKPLDFEGGKLSCSGETSLVGKETEAIGSDKDKEGRGRTPKSKKRKPLGVEGEKPSGSGRTSLVRREAGVSGFDEDKEGHGRTPKSKKKKPLDVEGGKASTSGRTSLVGREAEVSSCDKGEEGHARTPKSMKRKPLDAKGGKPSGSGRTSMVGKEAEISGSKNGEEGHGRTSKSRKRSDDRNADNSEEQILDNSLKPVPVGKKGKARGSNENQSSDGASLADTRRSTDDDKANDSQGSRHRKKISEKQESGSARKEKPNSNGKPPYVKSKAKANAYDKDKSNDGESHAGRMRTSLLHEAEADGPEGSKSKRRQRKNSENAERVSFGERNMDNIDNTVADAKESESKINCSEERKTDDEIKKSRGAAVPPAPPLQFIKRNLKRMVKMLNRYPAATGEGVGSADELKPEVRDILVAEVSGLLQKVNLLTGGETSAATSGGNG